MANPGFSDRMGAGTAWYGDNNRNHTGIVYVEASALPKLLVREAESTAIEREFLRWSNLATSIITEVELPWAVARAREERPEAVIDGTLILEGVLSVASIIPLSNDIVIAARDVSPVHVGALDAIHIASALSLEQELACVATYDVRMANALRAYPYWRAHWTFSVWSRRSTHSFRGSRRRDSSSPTLPACCTRRRPSSP